MKSPLPLDPNSPDVVMIGGRPAELLLEICEGSGAPTLPPVPRLVSAKWGDFTLAGTNTEWQLEEGQLDLTVRELVGDPGGIARSFGILDQPGTFVLETGDTLTARFVYVHQQKHSLDLERQEAVALSRLRLDCWTWEPRTPGCLWIGLLGNAEFDDSNLLIHCKGWWSSKHLRLRGSYDLYVVRPRRGAAILVVDTKGRPLDHRILATDFLALEFALGRPLELEHLTAISPDNQAVGAAGLSFGGTRGRKSRGRCPVAGRLDLGVVDESIREYLWVPVLFELLADHLHREGEDSPLFTALTAYLDSLSGHVHAAYLLAQVALEAFCCSLVQSSTGVLVKDPKAWAAFVNQLKEQILDHAVDEEAGRKLVNKVISAQHAPSTDRLLTALQHFELRVPQEALREVSRRNAAAHRFLMAKESAADAHGLADRVAIIQTLLAAIVAKHIGFEGPIVGWEWARGRLNVPNWWPWKKLDQARRRYLVLDPSVGVDDREEIDPGAR